MAEDSSDSSHESENETALAEPGSDEHSTGTSEHTSPEEHAAEDAQADPAAEHQTQAGHSEATKDHAETTTHDDHGDTKTADSNSGVQDHSNSGSQETHDASVDTADAVESTAQAAASSADDAPAEPHTKAPEAVQQAALPKVTAPDHNSLPQWQRNRQNIDRRWLKDADGKPKPRIAFVLSELGLAPIAAEEIIKKLPPAITLSFSPYAKPRSLEYLSALARANGHEVMLDLPLEPIDFPQRDPGPKALLTALEPKENLDRLTWSLNRTTGYVGVAVWMGSRFVASPRQMRPLYEAIHERGLIVLDNAEREDSLSLELAGEFGVPTVSSHRYVDVPLASRDAIDARLAQIERIALQFGSAVAMGRPFPVTVERLAEWSADLEKRGIILVPITVLAEEAGRQQKLAYKPVTKSVPQAKAPDSDATSAAH